MTKACLTYEDFFGPRNYSFDLGKIHFVVLDNCIYIKGYRRYPMIYGLEDEFLEWLKGDLARVPKDMPVIVCQHANVFGEKGVEKWVFENKPGTYKLNEFLEALQGFEKVYVFAGHTHAGEFIGRIESPANPSGVETFIVGRGVGGYANEHTCPEGPPRGYVIMDVDGKNISWRYHLQLVDTAPFRGEKKPNTPIIFISSIWRERNNFNTESYKGEMAKMHMADSLMKIACKKYNDVYFVKSDASTPGHNHQVDGVHPDDYGYELWAKSICNEIVTILCKYGISGSQIGF